MQNLENSGKDLPSIVDVDDDLSSRLSEEGSDLINIMAGANVGLALFDSNLRLLVCNKLYYTLCGYREEDVQPGTALEDLIRISLSRHSMPEESIEELVQRSLDRLVPGETYSFSYTSPNSRELVIGRRRLPSGSVVETIREVQQRATAAMDLNSQFSKIASAARERMMHALDVMPDGFALFDAKDRLVVYNRQFLDLYPHVGDLIIPGAKYEDILRASVERGVYDLAGMEREAYISQRLHQHHDPKGPLELRLSDGRWVMVNERPTSDGGVVKIRADITDMKQREIDMLRVSQQLHSKNVHFDSALNNMVQGLCMFDRSQRLIVCNKRYLEVYGFSPEIVKPGIELREILNYSVSLGNYTNEESQKALAERRDPTALSQRVTIKQHLRDGRVIAVMNEPMADGGTIATYEDITESERFAEQTKQYMQRLELSNQELQEFAYVASHDLQEPLRKIEAFGDRLARRYGETLPDDGKMFIDRMQNAAMRMRRLINDLLSYSRVASKKNPFVPVDLGEVISGVMSDLQIRIDETEAEIVLENLPVIDGDPLQLQMLFQNLISNSLKFRREGVTPVIKVTGEKLGRENDDAAARRVRIILSDNGIGFDNAYKHQMFKIFQRLHGRMEFEGTGVGLATVRKIVDRHGGTLDADGREGEGASFIIELPTIHAKEDVLANAAHGLG